MSELYFTEMYKHYKLVKTISGFFIEIIMINLLSQNSKLTMQWQVTDW